MAAAKDQPSRFDRGGAKAPPAAVRKAIAAGLEYVEATAEVDRLDEQLKLAKSRLNTLKTKTVPECMTAILQKSLTMEDGTKIEIKDFVSGSLPKDDGTKEGKAKRAAGIKYLEKNEGTGLIKSSLQIDFEKSEHNMALSLIGTIEKAMKEMGLEREPLELETTVNAQSLGAYARERLANGEKLDLEVLGLYSGKFAVVVPPPKKKESKATVDAKTKKGAKP